MKSLQEYIVERYINALQKEDIRKYGNEILNMLKEAYKHIGGCKGIETIDDLCNDSDMIKMVKRGGKIVAVRLYTFKRGGRKSMAMASDGTELGKKELYKLLNDDFQFKDRQTWSEQSGKALGSSLKRKGCVLCPNYIALELMPDKAKDIKLKDDGFFYTRKIGGEFHTKCIVGNVPNVDTISVNDDTIAHIKELSMKYEKEDEEMNKK